MSIILNIQIDIQFKSLNFIKNEGFTCLILDFQIRHDKIEMLLYTFKLWVGIVIVYIKVNLNDWLKVLPVIYTFFKEG